MVGPKYALLWHFAVAFTVALNCQITQSQNSWGRKGALEVIWSNHLGFQDVMLHHFQDPRWKWLACSSLCPPPYPSWPKKWHFLSAVLHHFSQSQILTVRSGLTVTSDSSLSELVNVSCQGPWTVYPICLIIPWPNPLSPRLHLARSSLTCCCLESEIPKSDRMWLCEFIQTVVMAETSRSDGYTWKCILNGKHFLGENTTWVGI